MCFSASPSFIAGAGLLTASACIFKYKKVNNRIVEDCVGAGFKAIGSGLGPRILKVLSKKDPKIGQLVKDLENSRDELDKHIKTKSSLSKSCSKKVLSKKR